MIKFSVCLETIFGALPLEEAFTAAAGCGASAVEFWNWKSKNLDAITRAKEAAGLKVAAFCGLDTHLPNDPSGTDEAVRELMDSVNAARQLGAAGLVVTPGRQLGSSRRDEQLENLAGVLSAAAEEAERGHAALLLEPLNGRAGHSETLLRTFDETVEVLAKVGRSNVMMVFDIRARSVGDPELRRQIEANIGRIGHFHVADAPDDQAAEPHGLAEVLRLIDSLGYQGYVGLEFRPAGDHARAVKDVIHLV